MYCKDCGTKLTENAKFCHRCGSPAWDGDTEISRHADVADERFGNEQPQSSEVYPAQPAVTYPTQRKQRRGRRPGVTLALSFLLFMGVFVFQVIGYLVGNLLGDTGELSATVGAAVGAVCGMLALGGASLLRSGGTSIGLAFKKGWWAVLVDALLCVFGILEGFVFDQGTLVQDWPLKVLWLFAFCACIGISEEGMFRGILLGGVLDVCGKNRKGIMMAALIVAVLFGIAHVEWWSINWLDPLQTLQAVLKVVQTGTLGFFLAALVIRGKSIWGPSIIHGLGDFLIMLPSIGLLGQSAEVNYVNTGEEAVATIILYVIVIVLYLPLVVSGVKMLREAPAPDRGAFHRETYLGG